MIDARGLDGHETSVLQAGLDELSFRGAERTSHRLRASSDAVYAAATLKETDRARGWTGPYATVALRPDGVGVEEMWAMPVSERLERWLKPAVGKGGGRIIGMLV